MSASAPADIVRLREVMGADIAIFYEQQCDPEAVRMAAFPARSRAAHDAHWQRILGDPRVCLRTIVHDERVAGNVASFDLDADRLVGYWLGRAFWGRGVATRALTAFLPLEPVRPLFARVAKHNVGSRRVLEKCGFRAVGEGYSPGLPGEPPVEEWIYRLDSAAFAPTSLRQGEGRA